MQQNRCSKYVVAKRSYVECSRTLQVKRSISSDSGPRESAMRPTSSTGKASSAEVLSLVAIVAVHVQMNEPAVLSVRILQSVTGVVSWYRGGRGAVYVRRGAIL
jgi:hypothetical protein